MEADLKILEDKLTQLIALCQTLRSENFELRQDIARTQEEARQLKDNMTLASQKLKTLIERLPHDEVSKDVI